MAATPHAPKPTANLYDSSAEYVAGTMDRGKQHTERLASSSRRRRTSVASSAQSGIHHAREMKNSIIKSPEIKPSTMPAPKPNSKHSRAVKAPAPKAVDTRAKATADFGIGPVEFHVRHASGMASSCTTANLLQYSTKTCWQSYARTKETIVLALCVGVYCD
ncbi:hypothetical protein FI667_g13213, partial [Globisporangium splendens]